jgi:hypothetical protein
MASSGFDSRSDERRLQDQQVAEEPHLAPLDLPAGAAALPVEVHLQQQRSRPLAIVGIVENGLVRPLDPSTELPEHSRVIIVAPGRV